MSSSATIRSETVVARNTILPPPLPHRAKLEPNFTDETINTSLMTRHSSEEKIKELNVTAAQRFRAPTNIFLRNPQTEFALGRFKSAKELNDVLVKIASLPNGGRSACVPR